MENRGCLRTVIIGLLMLGLLGVGLQQAQAVGCSYTQIQCIQICEGDDTPHETCVEECGCSEVRKLHSKSGTLLALKHAEEAVGCSYTQIQCIQICEGDDTPHETCVEECGCSEVRKLHSESSDDRCKLGCSSKCNQANIFGEYVKERCNDVCYSLCAKGVDIAAATVA